MALKSKKKLWSRELEQTIKKLNAQRSVEHHTDRYFFLVGASSACRLFALLLDGTLDLEELENYLLTTNVDEY